MSKSIVLLSSDGESFEVDEAVVRKILMVRDMIENECADNPIPLHYVTGEILPMIIEYLKKHVDDDAGSIEDKEELETWDAEFMRRYDFDTLCNLMNAAYYLSIVSLLDLIGQTIADIINEKEIEEIRAMFNIVPERSISHSEEEEKVYKESEWV
ncbi:PREDICTED: SKP1-like protein 17 [Camelina sativa]|uniref:SKP1-like protein n=1 Tax=Camelina sativa TaxID=90675 RepID=A0ABM0WFZ6_CAMSA|nr:PREDICTED: SKP1-like protein 17 [Camelina sativa]